MQTKREKNGRIVVVAAVGVIIIGIACMVAGVVLMVKYSTIHTSNSSVIAGHYTSEARKSGLDRLLQKVQDTHFALYPDRIHQKPHITPAEIRLKYKPMDPSPSRLKYIADKSTELLVEFKDLRLIRKKLSIREKRALEIAKFWIKHAFPYGVPYGYDYYVGDWLLGPDVFCWMPICYVGESFQGVIRHFKPTNVKDMELLRDILIKINSTFSQYVNNLKMGIEIGMIRNIEGCNAGLNGLKHKYRSISLLGEQGLFSSKFFPNTPGFLANFLSLVEPGELISWQKKYGKSMNDSLTEYFLEHVGKPVINLLRYLEYEYIHYCVPGDVLRGYSGLPLSFVYKNGTKIRPTIKRLPSGERINGKESYKKILDYYTTSSISAEKINQLGHSLIDNIYNEVLAVARQVTGDSDNATAKEKFIKKIDGQDMYFNAQPIPDSESDGKAHKLCSSIEGAKKHCPTRWQAIQKWFTYSRQVMAALDAKTIDLFHFAGTKHTTPNCPVELKPDFNPSSAAQSYYPSDPECSRAALYEIPFFLRKFGPRYEEWTVCAHETRPGHHLQAQGYSERFSAADDGIIKWLSRDTFFLGFQEGWALYAESPLIAKDTDAYKDFPLRKYGMLKWQVWQVIRLIADTEFNSINSLSREQALEMIEKYIWDTGDIPNKEITRYQSLPGQATAYMVGKLHIMSLRNLAQKRLGPKFNLKDFHFQILQHGPSPFSFLDEMINMYIDCVLDSTLDGCEEVLNPPKLSNENNEKLTNGGHTEQGMQRLSRWRLR